MPTRSEPASPHHFRPFRGVAAKGKQIGFQLRQFVTPSTSDSTKTGTADDADRDRSSAFGVRTVRESGGSVVVTIPPSVIEVTELDVGDEAVVSTDGRTISLTERQRYVDDSNEI